MSIAVESVYGEILGRTGDGNRLAVLGKEPYSYGDLRRCVESLAAELQMAGVSEGMRVGIDLDPSFGYLVSLLAVRAAGATVVLFGVSWTPFEKRRCFLHAQPNWIIASTQPTIDEQPTAIRSSETTGVTLYGYHVPEDAPASDPDDAVIIYTSGTTGAPKGVVLPERAVSANVRAVAEYLALTPEDRTTVFTPTCYAYALSQFLTHALAGAAIFPMPTYLRFPAAVLQACHEHRLTGLAANPTSHRILIGLDAPAEWDLTSVRTVMTGGQFLDARLVSQLTERFPNTRVVNMYGASENSPRISYYWLEDRGGDDPALFYPVGRAVQGTKIEVRDEKDRRVNDGEIGEVVVTGTSLMRCFWRDPEATAAKVRDGWLHTGDLGRIDQDGLLVLTGRASNVINVGNEKVSPEDVERVFLEIQGVAEAGVYGVPDPVTGESVRAKVVLSPGTEVSVQTMQQHCQRVVSAYKVPREIRIVDALPRTLYGKLDRRRLKEE